MGFFNKLNEVKQVLSLIKNGGFEAISIENEANSIYKQGAISPDNPEEIIEKYGNLVSSNGEAKKEYAASYNLNGELLSINTNFAEGEATFSSHSEPYVLHHNHPRQEAQKLNNIELPNLFDAPSFPDIFVLMTDNNMVGSYVHDSHGNIWGMSKSYDFPEDSNNNLDEIKSKLSQLYEDLNKESMNSVIKLRGTELKSNNPDLPNEELTNILVSDSMTMKNIVTFSAMERLGFINTSYKHSPELKEWL
jgi:hypothetical protein